MANMRLKVTHDQLIAVGNLANGGSASDRKQDVGPGAVNVPLLLTGAPTLVKYSWKVFLAFSFEDFYACHRTNEMRLNQDLF